MRIFSCVISTKGKNNIRNPTMRWVLCEALFCQLRVVTKKIKSKFEHISLYPYIMHSYVNKHAH